GRRHTAPRPSRSVTGVRLKTRDTVISYLFILPALALVAVLLVVPMFQNIYYSFFDWNGLGTPLFIGLKNFVKMFTDRVIGRSMLNTVIWVVFTLALPAMGGLLVAVFVTGVRGAGFFKSIFFIPLTISFVATGVIWAFMFSKELGVLNGLFGMLGLPLKPSWLTDVPLNTFAMIVAWTWQQLGTNMVMFLMGLGTIPRDPIEACLIDGASAWQTFVHVKLPMLRPITTVVITMAMVNSFKVFDIIWVMTRGGPYSSSETLAVSMFRETFTLFHMGYGAAISVILSLIVILISAAYIRRMTKRDMLYY
ncbi:MAG TPA: sugar ABC transporter permease, partial [Candidatus Paceibacterota bacterium]|nr:sugar ABC transporter permease [Candidatus Paceibacterota bacterium]